MKKQVKHAFRKDIYLLGKDENGIKYWLEEPSWDCDWYWGLGYVETYINNSNPEASRDICSHNHFDSLFLNKDKCSYDVFKDFFKETTLSDNEIWQLLDYMSTAYTLRRTAEIYSRGYSYLTEKSKLDIIKSKERENEINQVLLPAIFDKIKSLLAGE